MQMSSLSSAQTYIVTLSGGLDWTATAITSGGFGVAIPGMNNFPLPPSPPTDPFETEFPSPVGSWEFTGVDSFDEGEWVAASGSSQHVPDTGTTALYLLFSLLVLPILTPHLRPLRRITH
jgi:hypothetical protein